MKITSRFGIGAAAVLVAAMTPAISASLPGTAAAPARMVITVRPSHVGAVPETLEARDVTVLEGPNSIPARVSGMRRLSGDLADMQLFLLLDDSTRSSSLGTQLSDLKALVKSLPATAQVGIGYMRNGTFGMTQPFTTDHEKAAAALRLPISVPGENGSPYFALSDLAKHWPSKQATTRRTVLMLTDGVDRYYDMSTVDDPYVDAAVRDVVRQGIQVYPIYLRGAGRFGSGPLSTDFAQSRLIQVSEQSGGYSYFEAMTDPVTIQPFLKDFEQRLQNQYEVTFESAAKGFQQVKVQVEMPGVKIDAPKSVWVR